MKSKNSHQNYFYNLKNMRLGRTCKFFISLVNIRRKISNLQSGP